MGTIAQCAAVSRQVDPLGANGPEIIDTVGKYPGGMAIERDVMRKIAIAGVVAVAAGLPLLSGTVAGHAGEGPWCHTFGGAQGSIENCSIRTLEACRFEIQGNGGSCSPNPHWPGNLPDRRAVRPLLACTPGRGDNALRR
jgi:hypothetical protein